MNLSPKLVATLPPQCNPGDLVQVSPGARKKWAIVAKRAAGAGAATSVLILGQPTRNLDPLSDHQPLLSAGADFLIRFDRESAHVGSLDGCVAGAYCLFAGGHAAIWLADFYEGSARVFDLHDHVVTDRSINDCNKAVAFTKWQIGIPRVELPRDPYEWVFEYATGAEPRRGD